MVESYFVKDPFGKYRSRGGGDTNSAIIHLGLSSGDHAVTLRSYYRKPISDNVKKLVEQSLAEGARIVTFEVGCLLQLCFEGADISEVEFMAKAIKERCMRLYWENVRSFLVSHIDPCYHDVILQ